jgi:flagellar biosynthesis/type III secretory pathway chaperone
MDESKEAQTELAYSKLITNLDELTKFYRQLLDLLRKEQEALVSADRKMIEHCQSTKEALLIKLRALDTARERYAKELGWLAGTENPQPRLLELATHFSGEKGERLRRSHTALDMVIKRAIEVNKENESYANSAIKTLNGALNEIKETVSGSKTYEKKGKIAYGPDKAGNFVSKEA